MAGSGVPVWRWGTEAAGTSCDSFKSCLLFIGQDGFELLSQRIHESDDLLALSLEDALEAFTVSYEDDSDAVLLGIGRLDQLLKSAYESLTVAHLGYLSDTLSGNRGRYQECAYQDSDDQGDDDDQGRLEL